MRDSWRLLLLRSSNSRTHPQIHTSSSAGVKVQSSSISSPLRTQYLTETAIKARNSIYTSYRSLEFKTFISRDFSSVVGDAIAAKGGEIEKKRIDKERIDKERNDMYMMEWYVARLPERVWDRDYIKVIKMLSKFSEPDDIKRKLQGIVIDQDLMKNVLEGFEWNPNVAKRFYNFLLEKGPEELKLNYEFYYSLYNSMLCLFGVNGLLDEFWDLAETMNTKRHLISSSFSCKKEQRYPIDTTTYQKVSEFFRKGHLDSDLEKLNMLFVIQRMDNRMINIALLFNTVACSSSSPLDWKKFQDIISNTLPGDFVKLVLEQECVDLKKALMLFRWIDWRSVSHKDDEQTFHFIASVLGKDDDFLDRYWKVVNEIKSGGDHERSGNIIEEEAIEFYENELTRSNATPSVNCCIYLLMKLTIAGEYPDITRVSWDRMRRVVNAFENNGGILTDRMVAELINTLVSVRKTKDLNLLAELVMLDEHHQWVQHCPAPNLDTLDRQLRARLNFSALYKGK